MTPTWDCTDARVSLGVYVLGAIDPAERTLVDNHLVTCRDCRDELAGLAGLPALLARVNPDEISRISAEKRYIVVTLIFLVEGGSNSDRTLAERCDVPESEYWTRLTFGRLIATIPLLNFANVEADAVYLAPGSDEDGLSMEDLHGGGYEYLKMLL